jgi:lipopolysaccharide export system permease protein
MILWDLLRIFVVTLICLTGLFTIGGAVAAASQRGLAPAQLLSVLPLMIPMSLPYTIPATTLFATCNVYGRLAKDQEITALRAAGVHLGRILAPAIVLGITASVLTLALSLYTIPKSFAEMRAHLLGDVNEVLLTVLKRQGSFKLQKVPYVIFARDVQGDRLIDAVFKRRAGGSYQYDTVARAGEARLRVEQRIDEDTGRPISEVVVEMSQCVFCGDNKNGAPPVLFAQHKEFRERLPDEVFAHPETPPASDVTWPELLRGVTKLRDREAKREQEIQARIRAVAANPNAPKHDRDLITYYRNEQKYSLARYRSYEVEVHLRITLALGCLCFVMVGAPVGIWTNRADFLSSFVIGFLPTITLYYPTVMCLTNLAKDGKAPIVPALWTADVLFAIGAIFMCWRLVRR